MYKKNGAIWLILALMVFMAVVPSSVQAEPSGIIQVKSRIIHGIYPDSYGINADEAMMILTAADQNSFENYQKLTDKDRISFLNQCLQNSWQQVAGSERVYVRLDYEGKVYAYIISSHLADPAGLELKSFDPGIDELHFTVLLAQTSGKTSLLPEPKPVKDRLFENIDYQKSTAIRVIIDEKPVKFDVAPRIIEGRTLVPMRAIFERFGLQVAWNEAAGTAVGYDNQHAVSFTIGQKSALVNGQEQILDVPASIIDGRTLIPLRFLSASLGYNVVWVGEPQLILISRDNIIEWRPGGYEAIPPYKEYAAKYINGVEYNEVRYTGRTRPAVSVTTQGIVQQMRGTFYRVDFSDGFGVAAAIPKHKVAYSNYEGITLGIDGSKTDKALDITKISIKGISGQNAKTFEPLDIMQYSANMPETFKIIYREQDFYLAAGSSPDTRELTGMVVFDSAGTAAGIHYDDGVHNCKLYLEE
ncbi:MAG: copper amine oxidase N-terminal domain-containing protein [Syntrophomonadaceae bacterium]|jgi:hypothetical protein|nr:copper amine oxidase N-terminal domain-containing protein [Syntrophomonadaceae bacterium]